MSPKATRVAPPRLILPSVSERYDPRAEIEVRRQIEILSEGITVITETVNDTEEASERLGWDMVREGVEEADELATLTLIPIAGADFDAILTSTKAGNQAWTAYAQVTPDAGGNYVDTVVLVDKHPSKIAYQVWADADGDGAIDTIVQQNVVAFDVGTIPNVLLAAVAYDGRGTATVTANVDSDTDIGLGGLEYRVDLGAWTDATVGTGRTAVFDITQTSSPQDLEVRGVRDVGTVDEFFGASRSIEIEAFTPPVAPAALTSAEVSAPSGSGFTVAITWYAINVEGKSGAWTIDIDEFKNGSLYRTVLTGRAAVDGEDSFSVDQNDATGGTSAAYYYVVRLQKDGNDFATAKTNTVTGY